MATVSIILPVHNGEKYLELAIESILRQTFRDFELIIINDGSTDRTEMIAKSFNDPRIVYINNEQNLGLSKSFNIGIKAAQGKYIARMDSDDISFKNRLEKQVQFLDNNPDIGVVGSNVVLIDSSGRVRKKHRRPKTHTEIKWTSLFSTPLVHPTVMGRAEIFKNNLYNEDYKNSEDYELWSRLLFTTPTKFANIQKPLLYYRTFPTSFTQKLQGEKRVVSAQNTISNIERYTSLTEADRQALMAIRQDKTVGLLSLWNAWDTYERAALQFCKTEHLKVTECLSVYVKLLSYVFFLVKYKIKHF